MCNTVPSWLEAILSGDLPADEISDFVYEQNSDIENSDPPQP